MSVLKTYSQRIKDEAVRLGFTTVGIAKADFLATEASFLKQWLEKGYHGEMQYMANHFEKRLDPGKLVEGTKSVIVLSHNYFPEKNLKKGSYKIARYAYGEDYHHVLKAKLHQLLQFINDEITPVNGRVFTDSAPVLERAWAVQAGLGWQGKNTLLIQKNKGSYFLLAELLIDIELDYDTPFKTDHCGTCTRCIEACPTQALLPGKVLDAQKCISYLTIELKNDIPAAFKNKWEDWIFGCDICQEVCPWNRFSLPHTEPFFVLPEEVSQFSKQDWEQLSVEKFQKLFKKSPLKRTKFEGLKRNLSFLK